MNSEGFALLFLLTLAGAVGWVWVSAPILVERYSARATGDAFYFKKLVLRVRGLMLTAVGVLLSVLIWLNLFLSDFGDDDVIWLAVFAAAVSLLGASLILFTLLDFEREIARQQQHSHD